VEKMLGYKPEEVVGKKRFYDFFRPDDREELRKAAFSIFGKKGSFKGFTNCNVHKNGSIVWLSTSGVPIVADDGKLLGYRGVDVNITERKRTEELLKDSVAKYRDFAESLPEIVFEIDAKGNLVFVNQKASQITGYSQDELGNNFNFIRLVVPDEREKAIANIKRLLSGENVGSNEYNLVKKDGAVFPVMIWATPRIVQNKVAGLRGIVVDISEHKKAEESLRETKEYVDNLLNYANAPIIVWDNEKKITLFNNAFEAFTGYSKESMLRENIEVLFPASHKTRILETIGKATRGEKWQSVEVPILCKDGQTGIALWNSANVTDKDGNIVATIAQGQNITERKKAEAALRQSEERYRSVFENSIDGVMISQPDGSILSANPVACRMLGMSEEELKKAGRAGIVIKDEKLTTALQERERAGDMRADLTFRRKDGTTFVGEVSSGVFTDAEGIIKTSLIIRDVTDRKKAEALLNRTMDQLVLVNEKVEVVGSLTRHDVRNKLSAMTGYAYLLKKKHADQADILDGVSKMEQAVKDIVAIFDFAKMYEQLGVEELKYINAEKALNEAIALFSGSSSLEFINDYHGLSLLADSLLTQLFYNLIDNSLKHGEKVTKIRVHYEKADQDELIVVFEDDGVGISAENKPKLFKEGFSTGGSSGHGLFLMRKMMSVYGWSIQENGELGKGAKFTMTIPRINQNGKENFQIA
jgi:PAS domain S-box-containing protein